jgi:hypothetical protein
VLRRFNLVISNASGIYGKSLVKNLGRYSWERMLLRVTNSFKNNNMCIISVPAVDPRLWLMLKKEVESDLVVVATSALASVQLTTLNMGFIFCPSQSLIGGSS